MIRRRSGISPATRRICCAIAAAVLASCTATHQVRTVGKGNAALEVTLGGPVMTNLGPPIPMPNAFIGGRYGLSDELDIAAAYNLTSPITPGIPLDLITSACWFPVQPGVRAQSGSPRRGWSLGGDLCVQWVTDFQHGLVVLPAIDLAGGYRYAWINPFVGCGVGVNFYRPRDNDNPLQICPYAGVETIIRDRLSLSLKATLFDVTQNLYGTQIKWILMTDKPDEKKQYAALGLALGIAWDWGRR